MALKTCKVTIPDTNGIEHAAQVIPEALYEPSRAESPRYSQIRGPAICAKRASVLPSQTRPSSTTPSS
jgi:hypothetical protein